MHMLRCLPVSDIDSLLLFGNQISMALQNNSCILRSRKSIRRKNNEKVSTFRAKDSLLHEEMMEKMAEEEEVSLTKHFEFSRQTRDLRSSLSSLKSITIHSSQRVPC